MAKKEVSAMIGIIAAMEEEMSLLREALNLDSSETICGVEFYESNDIILCKCGIGKVNSAMATTILIDHFECDLIINTGIAGGICGVNTKDVVIGNKFMYYDVDVCAFGYAFGQVPGMPKFYLADSEMVLKTKTILKQLGIAYKEAMVYSGDSFVNRLDLLKNVETNVVSICEMEGTSIAQVCVKSGVEFVSIRYVSDIVGHENQINDYLSFESEMAKRSSKICLEILKELV